MSAPLPPSGLAAALSPSASELTARFDLTLSGDGDLRIHGVATL
jgi:hypothetical protein